MKKNFTIIMGILLITFLFSSLSLAQDYHQSPMLDQKVESGEIEPVEERLPETPVVVEPKEIGKYGGTLDVMYSDPGAMQQSPQSLAYHRFLNVDTSDYLTLKPELCAGYDISEDKKTITFHLRKGLKWSDGQAFDTEDIKFWYDHVLLNKELTPTPPSWAKRGGEVFELEIIDDYNYSFVYKEPFPAIRYFMKMWDIPALTPAHFLEKYHIEFNETADKLAQEEGYDHWYQLYERVTDWRRAGETGLPLLYKWVPVEFSQDELLMERNPYYWKVDTEGNQLPYIDKIRATQVSSDAYNMKAITKDIDVAAAQTRISNYPLYKRNEDTGNYEVKLWDKAWGFEVAYMVNLTTQEKELREIFQDLRFRQALSHGINREEINQNLYFGRAEPKQASVYKESEYYEEEFGEAYVEYDPEKANQLLDEMGLEWDNNQEWRLRADGKPINITIEHVSTQEANITEMNELVKEYWGELGIKVNLKVESWDLWYSRMQANEHNSTVWWGGEESTAPFSAFAKYYVPGPNWWGSWWCPEWEAWWSSDGEQGEEPPVEVKSLYEEYDKMISSIGEKRIEHGKNILRSQAENLWIIGTVSNAPHPVLISNDLGNVPETSRWGCDYLFWYIAETSQWFFK